MSVTKTSRNFAEGVNRTSHENVTKVCFGRDLAAAVAQVDLSDSEAAAWLKDLHDGRSSLRAPSDKWQ
jgi:hypothetical protein